MPVVPLFRYRYHRVLLWCCQVSYQPQLALSLEVNNVLSHN